jgi:hypothetical protein
VPSSDVSRGKLNQYHEVTNIDENTKDTIWGVLRDFVELRALRVNAVAVSSPAGEAAA